MNDQKVWLVGGSSGIGLALAELLLQEGARLCVSARHAQSSESLQALHARFSDGLFLLDLDVTDTQSVTSAAASAWQMLGGIDCWIYNAGAYEVMRCSEWEIERFETMNQTNYMGAVRLACALLPLFRAQGHGRWRFNLSISSYFGLPYGGGYSAPKAALANFAESIQPELAALGIDVGIINHGFVRTRLTAKNRFPMPQLMQPQEAASKIMDALRHSSGFEVRFPFALSLALRLLRLLPYRLSLRLSRRLL